MATKTTKCVEWLPGYLTAMLVGDSATPTALVIMRILESKPKY